MDQPTIEHPGLGALADDAARRFAKRIFWQSIDDGGTLTFEAFAQRTRTVASALRGAGVARGTHVAVMLPNVEAFAITWFALARLGAVILPVNLQYTSRELAYVLDDGDAEFLLIDAESVPVLEAIEGTVRVPASRTIVHGPAVDERYLDWHRLEREATPASELPAAGADALMSIQYTSGSTGFPKGCLLTQDYWLILGGVRAIQGPAPRRILLDKPLSYMGGMWRLLVALYVGATVCVARKFTLSGMQQRIVEHDIDFFSVTDPVAKLPQHPGIAGRTFSWISCAGLSKAVHRDIEAKFAAPVRELYGMTETGSTLFMPFADGHMSGSGSCGRPAPYRECRIVDPATGVDVPKGQSGELWVRGRGILKGYYKKDEATRAAFSGEWFRTGDLFRQDDDGYFYILGRIKDSIRRSGENISSREVESVVASVPGVAETAVLGVPDEFRGEEVKAYLILAPGLTPSDVPPEAVFGHLEGRLAAFKVPRYLEYVADFPRTSSGKIAKQEMKKNAPRGDAYDRTRKEWTKHGVE
jgi:acyl-CoA synthetase (AMP-forming)/AMP-acid ligase II